MGSFSGSARGQGGASSPKPSAGSAGLKKVMGPWKLTALGVGVTVGAGLFSLTGVAAGQHAGPAVLLSFIVAAIACGFAGLCYAELAGMMPLASGSAYSYASRIMGRGMGWVIGWDLILEYVVAAAAVASSWSGYVVSLLRGWGIVLDPRFLAPTMTPVIMPDGRHTEAWFNAPAMLILALVSIMLMRGMKESSTINSIIVGLKLSIVALVIIVCLPSVAGENFHPFIPQNTGHFGHFGLSGIMQAASMTFFAYIGFDIVSTAARDTANPQRDLPLGILGSLLVSSILYVTFAAVMVGVVNYHELANDPNPVATLMDRVHIPFLAPLVKLGISVGYISVLYGLLLGQSRVAIAMSDDGLLPRLFARLNPRTHTPWATHILIGVAACVLAGTLPIGVLGAMTSIGTLLAFVIVCVAVMILRFRSPEMERCFTVPGGPLLVPAAGALSCAAVMLSMDGVTWARLVIWLVIGGGIYLVYGRRHGRVNGS